MFTLSSGISGKGEQAVQPYSLITEMEPEKGL